MIDPATRDAAYTNLALLRKRNDRTMPPIAAYIDALEKELERYRVRLATPVVAHLEDLERLTADAAAKPSQSLPGTSGTSMGVMEVIAAAEAQAASNAAAKPFWKLW
jgi:hypothetical protein